MEGPVERNVTKQSKTFHNVLKGYSDRLHDVRHDDKSANVKYAIYNTVSTTRCIFMYILQI